MTIKGELIRKYDTQEITSTFKKREIVVRTKEQYPQDILIEFTQDKTELLNPYPIGQEVEVKINLRGKSYTDRSGAERFSLTAQGWAISKV